ncbi:hypothetical protein K457DRAFT_360573 [Linnemannia elongata AG-77]|uniref:Secreted protein n=1 Tax=Linnemannia elongata AG-77 TaxID=1314771 RepID=A0A197K4U0_9FUNG|nr:hypothetical protein K457DRAFT_360573 [Linnemannia elongata AG-77]
MILCALLFLVFIFSLFSVLTLSLSHSLTRTHVTKLAHSLHCHFLAYLFSRLSVHCIHFSLFPSDNCNIGKKMKKCIWFLTIDDGNDTTSRFFFFVFLCFPSHTLSLFLHRFVCMGHSPIN